MQTEEQILDGSIACSENFAVSSFEPSTVVELLRLRAARQTDEIAYTFLGDGETEEAHLTYGELDRRARAIAALLQSHGAAGGRALLLYPSGLDYIAAFFGCLYAGVVAVPAYPPRPSKQNRNLPRVRAIVNDCQPFVALSTSQILASVESRIAQSPDLQSMRWQTTDDLPDALADEWQPPAIGSNTLAFLQYTSGSTATPKGVMVSHGNLLHNERLIKLAFEQTERSVVVGWLPLYHDMGLIGNVLQPLYAGARCVLMSPTSFLLRPFRWLQAISHYKATTSGGPNFAYELCVRKITAEQRACLDLSSWTTAFNGAEPIRHETMDRFAEVFAECGFRREAFSPCYGLAEATLIVSGGVRAEHSPVLTVEASALERNEVVAASAEADGTTRTLVNCGGSLLDQKIVIVNPETSVECAADEVGEIWVAGASVTHGYWNRPEETARTFHAYLRNTGEGPFLRTGDLGFLADGQLYVTGRLKDLIVIRGRNLYPHDIELTVERSHAALRAGCGAAFPVELAGEERLVVVQEIEYRQRPDVNEIFENVRQAVAEEHEVLVSAVLLLTPGSIPKTSSGKIQRHACRAKFLAGGFDVVSEWRAQLGVEIEPPAEVAPATTNALESVEAIESWLVAHLAARVGMEACDVDVNQLIARYGMDSLQAIELMHSVETSLGVSLPMASFLQSSTISQIATQIHAHASTAANLKPASISTANVKTDEHPLSHGQQALWFLHQLAPESAAYNIANAVRIVSALDVDALRGAFQKLVERHAALRTTFVEVDGKPVQRIGADAPVCFDEHDATAWDEAFLSERLTEESNRPFDLEHGPLFRVGLFRRSAQEHVVLVVAHHIVADFWSFAVLVHELGILYQAQRAGVAATLAPLATEYAGYARWHSEMLAGAEGERLWSYWQRQLAGELPVLNLPLDRQPPPIQTYRGDSYAFKLRPEIADGLKALSRDHEATLYMTLLAGFQLLLHRYTGQKEILVGSPTAGRSRSELANVVGYFVNPVVMRADLSGNPGFASFLQQVRQTVLAAFEHQEYPFALLVEQLQPGRDTSRPPLFQVMFTLQKSHLLDERGLNSFALSESGARMNLGELEVESVALEQRVAQLDLTLMMAEVEDGLAASLQYNTDLFDAATIARIADHFETLLESIVAQPDEQVLALPMLSESEQQRLLVGWNDTATDYASASASLHELIEAQAARTPDAVALVFDRQQLTYAELNARANSLAHYLRTLGAGAETRIGICMERSLEMVVGLLGILKAGGVYVPLDPAYPKERLAFMVADARLPLLLTQQSLLEELPGGDAKVITLDSEWETIAAHSADNLPANVEPENLAYIIYTSGSTGRPKGAMNSHRSIVNRLLWMQDQYQLASSDTVLQKTPFSFDVSVWEFFWPLMVGARLVVAQPGGHQDSAYLRDLICSEQVTTMHFVPSMLGVFLQEQRVEECTSLRRVICSGEALSKELTDRFFARLGAAGAGLHNLYGPTEAAIDVSYWECEANSERVSVPIGRPISNIALYILDAEMRAVPVGVGGELYIGGVGLARGYWNRAELTAERFVPHPYSRTGGERLYRTGDVARFAADGAIEYLGRIDHQVKVRGFRIELGEIEAALVSHATVQEAAVIAREENGDKRLVAYVVAASGETISASELRSHVGERLPEYMIPMAIVEMGEMPLMPNGKLDRNALPAPPARQSESDEDGAARTPVEEMLTGMWADVLGVKQVGVRDNFFELGGHSLLATQLMSRVRSVFQVEIPLRRLFEAPTIAGLAETIEREAGGGRSVKPIEAAPRGGDLPLSFAQQRLWFLEQLEPGCVAYNMPASVRLKGHLNVSVLERTLGEIFRRHEIWRTTFASVDGRPVQVIAPAAELKLAQVDLSGSLEAGEAEATRFIRAEARRPFDLTTGPLFRATLVRLQEDEHLLVIVMHHIVSDGWSMGVLIREVAALYDAFSRGAESPLAELEIQYADYAVWQREHLQGEVLETQLAYWREQLKNVPVLELPTDRARPAVQSLRGAEVVVELSESLSEELQRMSRREGVTQFMVLLAAFKVLMSRWSGQSDVVVGTPIAGRTRAEVEPLIGFFVNTLAMRTRVDGEMSFGELLKQVREVALEAYGHQEVPFEMLVEELSPGREMSHTPLFQVMFVLQNAPREALKLPGVELSVSEVATETAKFDVVLVVEETEGRLRARWEYSTDLFDAATVARMASNYRTLLESVVAQPAQAVASLPLLTAAERQQLLVEWNDTRRDYPQQSCMHQLFEEQAARTPDAVALVFDEQRVTYRELNERANMLAHRLRHLGVGRESLVGIMLERSTEMIAGLLAILKAGGAYVPLDPQYPKERLAFMVEDTRARVILAQESLLSELPPSSAEVVCLDRDWESISTEPTTNPNVDVSSDNLAYMIYTSGSTGRPKGVAIEHRNAATLIHWSREVFTSDELAGVLASTSICFDLSIFEIFVPLAMGGKVILAENALHLPTLKAAAEVTLVNTVPSAMTELARIEGVPPTVRAINLAGEPLKRSLVQQIYRQETLGRLFNLYGPSEDTTYSTWCLMDKEGAFGQPSIGVPLANTQIYLLDAGLQPVPVGVTGELYIGGDGLARGYLNRPEMTAEKFVPNPFGDSSGTRLYKTGDLARHLADGRLDFLGRIDHQVKIRGFRIELGEIEALLSQHAGVREVVVVARDEATEKRLVAYVVAHDEESETLNASRLRAHLQERLPEHMIPSAFVMLDALPQTPNGKVDRRVLPAPDAARPDMEQRFVAPRTATEATVAGMWKELLGVEAVGAEDNFFELGGHSLLATQLMSRVRETFGAEVALRRLFESPTVAALASLIDASTVKTNGNGNGSSAASKIKAAPRGRRKVEQLRAEVGQLSEAEARRLVDAKKHANRETQNG